MSSQSKSQKRRERRFKELADLREGNAVLQEENDLLVQAVQEKAEYVADVQETLLEWKKKLQKTSKENQDLKMKLAHKTKENAELTKKLVVLTAPSISTSSTSKSKSGSSESESGLVVWSTVCRYCDEELCARCAREDEDTCRDCGCRMVYCECI